MPNGILLEIPLLGTVPTVDMFAWIGLNDIKKEGDFRWTGSGQQPVATFWRHGEPNNKGSDEDCVMMAKSDGFWLDHGCYTRQYFVCERFVIH